MSTATITTVASQAKTDSERAHRIRVRLFALLAFCLVATLLVNGFSYYRLPLSERPFAPGHDVLKPSGTLGLKLGVLGFFTFCGIFLYPLRKKSSWLQSIGSSKHWLDFHVVMGLTAPWIIACHSSFRFSGFAGLAFWTMVTVAASGVVGRYLYAQIPRHVNSAELSLKESVDLQSYLVTQLSMQQIFSTEDLAPLMRVPPQEKAAAIPLLRSLLYMLAVDVARPFHVARLRLRSLTAVEALCCAGGLLRSRHTELELVIALARNHAKLSKRVAFLAQAQRTFRLWHVIHRPFSFTFIILVVVHISVVTLMGFTLS